MIALKNLIHLTNPDHFLDLDPDVLQNLPFHFYWKDQQGKYLGCNDTQAKAVGFVKGTELLGSTDFDLSWAAHAPILKENDNKVMHHGAPQTLIEPATDANGNPIIVFSYKMPLRTRSKNVIGTLGTSFWFNKEEVLGSLYKQYDSENQSTETQKLTRRQADCLYFLIKGMTIKQIANKLNLSPKTIEHYLEIVKLKLNCKNRADLIIKGSQLPYIKFRLLL